MPTIESLVLEASVIEDFEDTLTELAAGLAEIDRLAAETVEDIDADVQIGDALADLETLDAATRAVDDEVTIETNVDGDVPNVDVGDADRTVFDPEGPLSRLGDMELASLLDMQSGFGTHVPTQGTGGGNDGGDGGNDGGDGRDFTMLSEDTIQRAKAAFGDAFDEDALVDSAGEIRDAADLLDGRLSEFVDTEEVRARLLDPKRDLSFGDLVPDGDGELPGLDVIQNLDDELKDLPEASDGLLQQFKDLNLKMGDFFKVFASLLPLIGIFVGALPAAITGVVTLAGAAITAAGALAAIGGLSLLGMTLEDGQIDLSNLQDEVRQLRETFVENFGPIANELEKVGQLGFETLLNTIRASAEELAFLARQTDVARGALAFIEETVPSVIGDLARLGVAAAPVLGLLSSFAAQFDLIQSFASALGQTLPMIVTLGLSLAKVIGPLIDLSMGFAFAATVLLGFVGGLFQLLDAVPFLLEGIGLLVSVLLALVTVSAVYTLVGETMIGTILAQAAAWASQIPIIGGVISALQSYTASQIAATIAAAAFLGVITFGLAPAIGALTGKFGALGGKIDKATSSLKDFGRVSNRLDGTSLSVAKPTTGTAQNPYNNRRGSNRTIAAPDTETGTRVANIVTFKEGTLDASNESSDRTRKQDRPN